MIIMLTVEQIIQQQLVCHSLFGAAVPVLFRRRTPKGFDPVSEDSQRAVRGYVFRPHSIKFSGTWFTGGRLQHCSGTVTFHKNIQKQ